MKRVRKPDSRDGWYEFTPASAQEVVEAGAKNRAVSENRADSISLQIKAGTWRENGESLVFDDKGRLMDGQHRLRGCVLADRPIICYCVFGVPYNVFSSLDQGKVRSGADLASLMRFPNHSCVAAVARLSILYAEKKLSSSGPGTSINNDQLRAYMARNRDAITLAVQAAYSRRNGIVKLIPISHAAFVYYKAAGHHEAIVTDFLDKLATGAGLQRNDALLLFRERMKSIQGEKHSLRQDEKLALLIKAWNAFVGKKPVGTLKWNKDVERFPMFFGETNGEAA
jgi:hypothetical protein